ncbi:MAG TPA: hypothetical protein VFG04_08160 [Planctomycetaceae bacterium]|jgi:hypothetical protein|nr:hypothetical protein [Planctomycetaceae bacterium]
MTTRDTTPRLIEPQIVYSLSEFSKRTGLGESALRTARKFGLKVLELGGRRFVRGRDWCAYCDGVADGSIVLPKKGAES